MRVYSNELPMHFFAEFRVLGFDVRVRRVLAVAEDAEAELVLLAESQEYR